MDKKLECYFPLFPFDWINENVINPGSLINVILAILAIFIPFAIVFLTNLLDKDKKELDKKVLVAQVFQTKHIFLLSVGGIFFLSLFTEQSPCEAKAIAFVVTICLSMALSQPFIKILELCSDYQKAMVKYKIEYFTALSKKTEGKYLKDWALLWEENLEGYEFTFAKLFVAQIDLLSIPPVKSCRICGHDFFIKSNINQFSGIECLLADYKKSLTKEGNNYWVHPLLSEKNFSAWLEAAAEQNAEEVDVRSLLALFFEHFEKGKDYSLKPFITYVEKKLEKKRNDIREALRALFDHAETILSRRITSTEGVFDNWKLTVNNNKELTQIIADEICFSINRRENNELIFKKIGAPLQIFLETDRINPELLNAFLTFKEIKYPYERHLILDGSVDFFGISFYGSGLRAYPPTDQGDGVDYSQHNQNTIDVIYCYFFKGRDAGDPCWFKDIKYLKTHKTGLEKYDVKKDNTVASLKQQEAENNRTRYLELINLLIAKINETQETTNQPNSETNTQTP